MSMLTDMEKDFGYRTRIRIGLGWYVQKLEGTEWVDVAGPYDSDARATEVMFDMEEEVS